MANHVTKKGEAKNVARLLAFSKIWNDIKSYPTNYDLERKLEKKIGNIRAQARRYQACRLAHPGRHLPELVLRRLTSGSIIAVPPGVLSQLDPFRINIDKLRKAKTIVVTSHQFGANLNPWHWASLNHYAEARGAMLVVMPIKYGPIKTVYQQETHARMLTSTFPDELRRRMLFEDLELCGGELMLNVTRLRPTLERFLTDPICEMGGMASQIFAAPVIELEHRPRIGRDYPKAIMTTGACHYPNYMVDNLGQQDRAAEVATEAHTFAAVVVEMDGNTFHFRHLHADKRGRFYDINPKKGGADYFTPEGVEHRPDDVEGLVCGDWHTGKTDPPVRRSTFGPGSMTALLKPNHVVLHDFIDCDSVSPYEKRQGSRRGYKGPLQQDSLEGELNGGIVELKWMRRRTDAQLHVVASNHNEYVTEYIEGMYWKYDDANLAIGSRLFNVMVEDLNRRRPKKADAKAIDPVVWWLRTHAPFVHAHERQDELLLPKGAKNPILCSMHGDKGPRGSETRSTKAFRKMNMRVILGHNHSALIFGPVCRVGTSTPRRQFYVTAPATDWTNTHALIFRNGQRMLIHFIRGRWYGRRQWSGRR